jgi:hypothetical protein
MQKHKHYQKQQQQQQQFTCGIILYLILCHHAFKTDAQHESIINETNQKSRWCEHQIKYNEINLKHLSHPHMVRHFSNTYADMKQIIHQPKSRNQYKHT